MGPQVLPRPRMEPIPARGTWHIGGGSGRCLVQEGRSCPGSSLWFYLMRALFASCPNLPFLPPRKCCAPNLWVRMLSFQQPGGCSPNSSPFSPPVPRPPDTILLPQTTNRLVSTEPQHGFFGCSWRTRACRWSSCGGSWMLGGTSWTRRRARSATPSRYPGSTQIPAEPKSKLTGVPQCGSSPLVSQAEHVLSPFCSHGVMTRG